MATADDIDSFVTYGQQLVSEQSTQHMPSPCSGRGTWNNGFSSGRFFSNATDAVAYELAFVPSVGAWMCLFA
jgi:hypothetical protein